MWKPRTAGHCLPWYGSKVPPLETHKGLCSTSLVSVGQTALPGAPELKLSLCCPGGRSQVSTEQTGEEAGQTGDNRRLECFRTRSRAKVMEAALLRSGG